MPITVQVRADEKLVRFEIVGDFTLAEIFDAIDGALEDAAFEPGFNVLTDHRRVGEPLTTFQAEQTVAHLDSLRDRIGGARWAAVVKTPASRGMLRMVATLAERVPVEVRLFESIREAEAWLAEPKAG